MKRLKCLKMFLPNFCCKNQADVSCRGVAGASEGAARLKNIGGLRPQMLRLRLCMTQLLGMRTQRAAVIAA